MNCRRLFLALQLVMCSGASLADVIPASLFREHAVLQAGKPLPVWGRASPGEKVTVQFADQTLSTTTDVNGRWMVRMAPLTASSRAARMSIDGNNSIVLEDILVGEVWLCSGQSNMEFQLSKVNNAEQEIRNADHPQIRQFLVKKQVANTPLDAVEGQWQASTPATAAQFSGVAYFFARKLQQTLKTPVGIINSSWGGTDIEGWLNGASLGDPELAFVAQHWQNRMAHYPEEKRAHDARASEEEAKFLAAAARGEVYRKVWQPTLAKPDGSPHWSKAANLFNGMVHPLAPAALAGVLWYQGENNAGRFDEYRKLFPALIKGWRSDFGQPDLPFYWVQLPNYRGSSGKPDWASMRAAQNSALSLPNTGSVVTIDIGTADDVHPKNKQDVGLRLALLALQRQYGGREVAAGPVWGRIHFADGAARASFEGQPALVLRNGSGGFELAGADHVFHDARARLEGQTVVVESASVPHPLSLRYAWSNTPVVSLFNQAGLPAAPFNTETR